MKTAVVIAALAVALLLQSTIAGMSFAAGSRVNLVLVAVIYVALAYGAVTGMLAGVRRRPGAGRDGRRDRRDRRAVEDGGWIFRRRAWRAVHRVDSRSRDF